MVPEPKADCPPEPKAEVEVAPPKVEVDPPNGELLELPNRPLEVVVVVPPAPNVDDAPNGFLFALSGLAVPPNPPRKPPPPELLPPNTDPEAAVAGVGLLEPPNTLEPAEDVPELNGDAVEA